MFSPMSYREILGKLMAVSRFMQRTLLVVLIMEPFWDVEARCFCTCSIQTSVYEVE